MDGAGFNTFFPSTNPFQPLIDAYPLAVGIVLGLIWLGLTLFPIYAMFVLNPKAATTLWSSIAATVLIVGMYLLLQNANVLTSVILPAFLTCLFIWTSTFHWLAYHLGYYFRDRFGDGKPWVKHWVREIDYIYLIVSSVSLLKLVISQIHPHDELKVYNAVAAVALGTALALRITKTSIEVWGWDDPGRAPNAGPQKIRPARDSESL